MEKIAIVTSEGGARCSYSVGAILALVDKFGLTEPDLVIGASGSTGTLAYFVAGQYESIRNIWENLLPTKKFVSYLRLRRIMDIDYLVDEIFAKQDPLDISAVKSSPIGLYIVMTDLLTGKPTYFPKDQIGILEALRASSAIPVFFNKTVSIAGREYIDGAISFHFEDGVKLAKELGATKIIGIYNRNDSLLSRFSGWIYSFFQKEEIREEMRRSRPNFENDPDVIIIKPSKTLAVSTLDNKQSHLKEAIKTGYLDAANNKNLQNFLASASGNFFSKVVYLPNENQVREIYKEHNGR